MTITNVKVTQLWSVHLPVVTGACCHLCGCNTWRTGSCIKGDPGGVIRAKVSGVAKLKPDPLEQLATLPLPLTVLGFPHHILVHLQLLAFAACMAAIGACSPPRPLWCCPFPSCVLGLGGYHLETPRSETWALCGSNKSTSNILAAGF